MSSPLICRYCGQPKVRLSPTCMRIAKAIETKLFSSYEGLCKEVYGKVSFRNMKNLKTQLRILNGQIRRQGYYMTKEEPIRLVFRKARLSPERNEPRLPYLDEK